MADEIEARISPESFKQILADAKAFDPALARSLRKKLRGAGEDAVKDVKATLREPTPGGTSFRSGGVRAALAAKTKVSILTGRRMQGVRITTTAAGLTPDHKVMLAAYNKTSWRRPTRGRKSFVTQSGRPYFGAVVESRQEKVRVAVEDALIEAAATIKSGRPTS